MSKKNFTCKKYSNVLKSEVVVAHLGNDVSHKLIVDTNEKCTRLGITANAPEGTLLAGPVADTLYAYEQLGYSPDELQKIIDEHKTYKEQLWNQLRAVPDKDPPFYRDIHAIIDTGMKKRDRRVSITFTNYGITVDVTPYPVEEDEEND